MHDGDANALNPYKSAIVHETTIGAGPPKGKRGGGGWRLRGGHHVSVEANSDSCDITLAGRESASFQAGTPGR